MTENRCLRCGSIFAAARSDQMFCCASCRKKYNQKPYLTLPIKKKWFDMILSGEKKEEYREIKPYWEKRFLSRFGKIYSFNNDKPQPVWNSNKIATVRFKNGYSKNARYLDAECTIREGEGKPEWGAEPGKKYYILDIQRIEEVH